jgi:hypothetical protein
MARKIRARGDLAAKPNRGEPLVKVTIYVEGGGDSEATRTKCRKGFATFFKRLLPGKAQPRIVPCGGRQQAFDDFCIALENLTNSEQAMLLVDSEEAVRPGYTAWQHLRARNGDGWKKPESASEDQVRLMVQCMESWFIADAGNLEKYYKQDFKKSKLPTLDPKNESIEHINKKEIERVLEEATKSTSKGAYHKTKHGFALLEVIDPSRICKSSAHAKMLRDVLAEWLDDRPI